MNILVTGSEGFIAKNIIVFLEKIEDLVIYKFNRTTPINKLKDYIDLSDVVIHCAGVNRPINSVDFKIGNTNLTSDICNLIKQKRNKTKIIFMSSTQANLDNEYGKSKKEAERYLLEVSKLNNLNIKIFRLPNVFGKWSKPNYNSVVATFCYNISREIPINITNPNKEITLLYVDDLVKSVINLIYSTNKKIYVDIKPKYKISLSKLAKKITSYHESKKKLIVQKVGKGFDRALYSTYCSFLNTSSFFYKLEVNSDSRGTFSEFLKTTDSGQISYFTANPGVTRGGHYHHTKNEKFLIVSGKAKFRFRNIITNEYYEKIISHEHNIVIETLPGWAHEVINIGKEKLIGIIWANENFDIKKPDTTRFTNFD